MGFRHDGAAAGYNVRPIAGVSGRGVDAEVVLDAQVRLAQHVVIAKDAVIGHRTVLPADRSELGGRSVHVIMVLAMCRAAERASRAHMPYRWLPSALRAPGEMVPGHRSMADVDREAVAVDKRESASRLRLVERDDVYFVAFGVDEGTTIRSVLDDDPPPGGHSRVDAGLGVVVRDEEVDMDAVAMLPPVRVRRVHRLEEQDRIEPMRIVDVGQERPWVVLVTEYGRPEGSHRRNVDRVNAELDETRARKVRREPQVAGCGLDPTSHVHEPARGGALPVLPLVLPLSIVTPSGRRSTINGSPASSARPATADASSPARTGESTG